MQRDYIREILASIPSHDPVLSDKQRRLLRKALSEQADDGALGRIDWYLDAALRLIDWYIFAYRSNVERHAAVPNGRQALSKIKQAAEQYAAAMQEAGPWVYSLDDAADQTRLFRDRYVGMEIKKFAEWAGYVAQFAATALSQLERGKRRPNISLRRMVKNLALVWEQVTWKKFQHDIKRGGCRDFIDNVAVIADPNTGPGEVSEAIRAVLSEYGRLAEILRDEIDAENEA